MRQDLLSSLIPCSSVNLSLLGSLKWLTLIRSASATSSSVLRLSSRGPLLIAPSFASSSVTAGIHSSFTSVSTMMSINLGEMEMELRRGCSCRSTACGFSSSGLTRHACTHLNVPCEQQGEPQSSCCALAGRRYVPKPQRGRVGTSTGTTPGRSTVRYSSSTPISYIHPRGQAVHTSTCSFSSTYSFARSRTATTVSAHAITSRYLIHTE